MADTVNTRGAIVASEAKKLTITMTGSVIGEDSKQWLKGDVKHDVSEPFATDLIRRNKAVAGDQSKKPAK